MVIEPMSQWWIGLKFSGRGIDADTHELIEADEKFYKIKNVPKEDNGYLQKWEDRNG